MPSRRAFLAALGVSVPAAGCTGTPGGTSKETPRTTTTTETSVAVESLSLQSSYVGVLGGHHREAVFASGVQYVLVQTTVPAGERPRPNATVTLDGEPYDSSDELTHAEFRGEAPPTPIVPVPRDVSPDEGSVTVDGVTESLDAPVRRRLANPPQFEVTDVKTPSRVTEGSEFPVELRVVHRGGRDDVFRANSAGCRSGWRVAEASTTAGAETLVEVPIHACTGDAQRVVVEWRGGRVERTVPVGSREGNSS